VNADTYTRSLQLPSPIRDVRALRTLILLDLESHSPAAPIERVTVTVDPTPGRVLQHALFVRAHPTPEQLATLVARLNALMGDDRVGRPARVDSYRPGAFAMQPFATEHDQRRTPDQRRERGDRREALVSDSARSAASALTVVSALRRCRQPVPARVVVVGDRPVAVTTDRRGFAGGRVLACAGPWRSSGEWWEQSSVGSHHSPVSSHQSAVGSHQSTVNSHQSAVGSRRTSVTAEPSAVDRRPSTVAPGPSTIGPLSTVGRRLSTNWSRDEWDVSLSDGAVYRIFQDRDTTRWFIDAIVD
jgi:hypothetical protein